MVCILNRYGKPLMPTENHRSVRLLLKEGKATVVGRNPFTIQLNIGTHEYRQPISLGVDPGYKQMGLSATTETKELYMSETELRTDVVKNLSDRSKLRRGRRQRKTRYRKPRFKNRKRKSGWQPPSVEQKINTQLQEIFKVASILPIADVTIECAAFDPHKLKDPYVEGVGYQQGDMYGYQNRIAYLSVREANTCQYCGKEGTEKGNGWRLHHIWGKEYDKPEDWALLHAKCHRGPEGIHAKHEEKVLQEKKPKSYKAATFMNIMRWGLYDKLKENFPSVSFTYGYITSVTRKINDLEKTHGVDARCISGNPTAEPAAHWYQQTAKRRHNRQTHKTNPSKGGKRKLNQSAKYVKGYQLFDKVNYNGQECFIFGRRTSGSFDVRKLDGTKISASISCKKLKLLEKRKTILTERRAVSSQG